MGKWYDKIFIGNPNKDDYSSKDLPKTRIEQFFDVIKLRFGGMVTANLMLSLFAIPLFMWLTFSLFLLSGGETADNLTGIEQVIKYSSDPSVWMMIMIINIPLYAIMGPAQAGLYYCLRNWSWNERATVGEHFWKEFKRSWKQAIGLNLFNATLFYAGFWWLLLCYMNMETYPVLKWVSVTIIVVLILYYMSTIYQFPQLVTYDLKVIQILKNSCIYLIVQFPRTLLAVVAYGLLLAACIWLKEILLVVAMSLGISFVALANMILSNFMFDKYVNAPENCRKGMAPLDK
ncbi:MAG: DUF624 domain-containing protein [Clostridiales bacterium]|nr:DUF624 domain-containing protein [Clostridiales bacterium]